ncbi:hypothetical protein K1T71_006918 [Dendrolimus kikuchii]|uniref:Uncharacterized protein n=1 Tax=Dendrolimus kikuchii TaxID=765133 RepID=A0ACC1CYW1_9NEOP|nr:hypothetical protein K1T71_006918 [Dendrolimus kikuchii]
MVVFSYICTYCKKYRYDYVYHSQINGWLKENVIPTRWHEARLRCHLEGSVLASPIDDGFLKILNNRSNVSIWTGVNSLFSKGDYYSIEGVSLLKMPIGWAPDEPDNYADMEQCITMMPNGTFADEYCEKLFPYFCYKKHYDYYTWNICGKDISYTYESRTGSCYKFHNHAQTWNRAFMICAAEGAHLAIMDTAVETQVLKEIFTKYPQNKIYGVSSFKDDAFVGILDWGVPGVWTTIHGESLDHLIDTGVISWDNEQPNDVGQSCGSIGKNGSLNDFWCQVPAPFICEKTPDSLEQEEDD